MIPEPIQDDLINAVVGCRNGVARMIPGVPEVVETSSNLAIVRSSEGSIEVLILIRSSSESMKQALVSSLESVFLLAGAKVEPAGIIPVGSRTSIHRCLRWQKMYIRKYWDLILK